MEWVKSWFGGGKPQEITVKNSKSPTVGAIVTVHNSRISSVVGTGTLISNNKVLTDARLFEHYEWEKNNFAESGPEFVISYPGYVLYFCMGLDTVSAGSFITNPAYKTKCNALHREYYVMRGFIRDSSFRTVIKKDRFGRPEKYFQWKKLSEQTGETGSRSRAMKNNRKAYALAIGEISSKSKRIKPYKLSKIVSPNKSHRYEIMGYSSKKGTLNQWDISGTLQIGHNSKSKWSTRRGLFHIKGIKTTRGAQGGPIFEYANGKQQQIGVHMNGGDIFFNDDILKGIARKPRSELKDVLHEFSVKWRNIKSQSVVTGGYFDGYGSYYDGNNELWMGGIGLVLFVLVVLIFFGFGACCGFVMGKKVKGYKDKDEEY